MLGLFYTHFVTAALLSQGYSVQSPCKEATATLLGDEKTPAVTSTDSHHWVAVFPGLKPVATAMFTLPTAPTNVGAPIAVVRLDLKEGRLDCMRCSIPKEEAEAKEVLGLAVDAAIETWLEHCSAVPGGFEALTAAATMFSAEVLRTRGFAELDDEDISFGQRYIASHRARLPSAIVAYERQASVAEDVLDKAMAEDLLRRLRAQPAVALTVDKDAAAEEAPKRDPWANIKGFGM